MLISVVIVSYNVRHFLRQCLDSVFRSAVAAEVEVEVFVVDNHSHDATLDYLRTAFPRQTSPQATTQRLHLVANQHNVGFGRANNQALQHCQGAYVLFLNPDTLLTEQTLRDCLTTAQAQPNFGAIGVSMLQADGQFAPESRRGLPTPWVAFCKMTGLTRLFPRSRRFAHYYMSYLPQDEVAPIDIVSGAFMFCRHEALRQTGGFDEAFFMYGEDIDLSYRFLKAGFQNFFVPTPILHYKGESTRKNTYRYVHVFYEAMLIFFRKHFPTSSFALRIPVHVAIYARAFLALLQQWLRSWSRFLNPFPRTTTKQLCVATSAPITAQLEAQAQAWDVQLHDDHTLPTGYSYLVLSPEETTYAHLLERLRSAPPQQSLATYFPSWRIMITGKEVFA